MLDKEIIAANKSRFGRDEVRDLLLEAWLGRPEKERNQFAAERFVEQAARDFEFETERPRTIVIRNWILPHIIRVEEERPTVLARWWNRPWFKRSHWPLRITGLVFLAYSVFNIFWNLYFGQPASAVIWVPVAAGAVLLLTILWIPRNNDR